VRRACAGCNGQNEAVYRLNEDLFVGVKRRVGGGSPNLAMIVNQYLARLYFDDDGSAADHRFFGGRPRLALRLKDFEKNRNAPEQDGQVQDQCDLPSEDQKKSQGQDGQQKDQMVQGKNLREFQETPLTAQPDPPSLLLSIG
jgi:hypothetical protein